MRIPDGSRIPVGADGGVSAAGTAASLVASGFVASTATATGLLGPREAAIAAVAGVGGALLDSLLGGTLERFEALDNEGVNLLSTLAAAWAAALLA